MVFDSFTLAGIIISLLIAIFLIALERCAGSPGDASDRRAVDANGQSIVMRASLWFGCPRTAGQAAGADRA